MGEGIEYFTLNTGARIPSLGLGTWQADPGVVGESVVAAIKAGYRHIDCARLYANEDEIGLALKKVLDDGTVKREELFITSKLWCDDHNPEDVPKALDLSLKDLQLDYVDLYLMHWPFQVKKGASMAPDNFVTPDIPASWAAMESLYDSGKARAIGVSNYSTKKVEELVSFARFPPAVVQVECHPGWQQPQLHAFCKSKGIHLSGYSPLGSPGTSYMRGNVLGNPSVVAVAGRVGRTPAQVALRWGLQMGHSVLPKSTKETRIKENLGIFGWSIPPDLFDDFSRIDQKQNPTPTPPGSHPPPRPTAAIIHSDGVPEVGRLGPLELSSSSAPLLPPRGHRLTVPPRLLRLRQDLRPASPSGRPSI